MAIPTVTSAWAVYLSATGVEPITQWLFVFAIAYIVSIVWFIAVICANLSTGTSRLTINVLFGVSLAFCLLTLLTQWPLRVSFLASQGKLDRLVDKLERGETVHTPLRVGTFDIREAEMRYGSYPALILDPDPNGPTSLVRARDFTGEGWSRLQLTEDWLLFSED